MNSLVVFERRGDKMGDLLDLKDLVTLLFDKQEQEQILKLIKDAIHV